MKFILDWKAGLESKTELCRRYGIQRRIGYKWVQRYQREGPAGLADLSRAPHHHPQQIAPQVVARILEIRGQHPLWGAEKIRAVLEREQPLQHPPAASTIGEILHHEGLTRPPKKRRAHRLTANLWHTPKSPTMSSRSTSRAGSCAAMAVASIR